MTKNKRQTRSLSKKNNKNNSPGRAHKRKQRRTKEDDKNNKEPSYSPNITTDDIAIGTSTATAVESTRHPKKLFKGKTTGLESSDNNDANNNDTPDTNDNAPPNPNNITNPIQPYLDPTWQIKLTIHPPTPHLL
jgi:hypothetical protein